MTIELSTGALEGPDNEEQRTPLEHQYWAGQLTEKEYLDRVADTHLDQNGGRSLPEPTRSMCREMLVRDALARGLSDGNRLPTVDALFSAALVILAGED